MAATSKVSFISIRNFEPISLAGVQGGNLAFCINVVKEAKPLAPKKEGQLRNSIQYVTGDGKRGGENSEEGKGSPGSITTPLKPDQAAFGATALHAVFQEFGTRFLLPQPYLRPAIALAKGTDFNEVIRAINREISNGVLRAGRKVETFGL